MFISKRVTPKQEAIFLEYLIKGKLNVYYYRKDMVDHYLVEKDSLRLIELPPLERNVVVDGQEYIKHDHKTMSIIEILTQDCPKMKEKIAKLYLEQKPLIKFAKEYHNRVCGDNGCIIYAKKTFPITFFVEPVFGFRPDNDRPDLGGKFEYGLILHNWMPRTNEKLFFKVGLFRSESNVPINDYFGTISYESRTIYRVPLMFEYVYPKGIFKPTLGYGWNIIYSGQEGLIIADNYNVGIITQIKPKIQISTSLDLLSSPLYGVLINQTFEIGFPTFYVGLRYKL